MAWKRDSGDNRTCDFSHKTQVIFSLLALDSFQTGGCNWKPARLYFKSTNFDVKENKQCPISSPFGSVSWVSPILHRRPGAGSLITPLLMLQWIKACTDTLPHPHCSVPQLRRNISTSSVPHSHSTAVSLLLALVSYSQVSLQLHFSSQKQYFVGWLSLLRHKHSSYISSLDFFFRSQILNALNGDFFNFFLTQLKLALKSEHEGVGEYKSIRAALIKSR